jgi:hypothetical protein
MFRALTLAAIASLLMGCSAFGQPDGIRAATQGQADLVNATCTNVMGLRKGDYYYAQCQDSLANVLIRRDETLRMVANEEACRSQDRNSNSAALATCMLDRHSDVVAPLPPQPVALKSAAIEPGKSYYSVTPTAKFQRERYSCAQLGLIPNSGAFGECVASLEGALSLDPD